MNLENSREYYGKVLSESADLRTDACTTAERPPLAVIKALAASPVPVIVAVSCNPNSFGRDAKILVESGYRLTTLWPVAQFRWSSHVELVARFERQA